MKKSFSAFRSAIAVVMLVAACAFSTSAMAIDYRTTQSAGFDNLSESQKAEVLKIIADKSAASKVDPASLAASAASAAPAKVDEWLNIGERVGKMIGGAAKEVGVAVNDFVKTPVGLTAMALIVWHYMGNVLVHVFGAMLVLTTCVSFLWYLISRSTKVVRVYSKEKKNVFGNPTLESETRPALTEDQVGGFAVCFGITIVITLITLFTY